MEKNISNISNKEIVEAIPLVPSIALNEQQRNILKEEKDKWLENQPKEKIPGFKKIFKPSDSGSSYSKDVSED